MNQQSLMPRPRIALQIGITGHRSNKIADEHRAAVDRTLRALYAMIDDSIAAIARETQGDVYSNAAPLIRIVSALAEGTDRLAVTAAPDGWQLEAILPMPRAEYARDFYAPNAPDGSNHEFERLLARAISVTELPLLPGFDVRGDAGRAQHYQALGTFLVRQIDLLVAVWDGRQAAGPGGTAAVIAHAFAESRPVLWIDPSNPTQPRYIVALDTAAHDEHRWQSVDASLVDHLLRAILMPPALSVSSHDEHDEHDEHHEVHGSETSLTTTPRTALPSYFGMSWPKPMRWPFAYNLLRRLAGAGRWSWPVKYPGRDDLSRSWDTFFSAVTDASGISDFNNRVRSILLPRSIWVDALAWRYGHIYRSAYVSIFFLAGLSVPIGLCYLFFLESAAILDIKAGFVLVELFIISTVVIVVRRGVRLHWHTLWLETRELSELLRLGRSLAYIGALRDFVAPQPASLETFTSWYVRATFREIGLPNAALDAAYMNRVLKAALATEIQEQRAYHTANARNLDKIHHMLHRKGDACFAATMYMLLIYLAAWAIDHFMLAAHAAEHGATIASHGLFHEVLEYYLKPIVSIAAAGLPALGAALSGIRAQGDFEGFAQRSALTQRELMEIERRIGALLSAPDQITLKSATDVLLAAALAMSEDVSAWHQLYVSKRLTLPA